MDTAEKRDVVETVTREALIVKAQEKLNRKSLDVSVCRSLMAVDEIEKYLAVAKLEKVTSEVITEAEQKLEALKKELIDATFVPLRTPEILAVQGVVTETALMGKSMGFDFDVQLFIMSKAERAATIYLGLRKRTNPSERYFRTQEEVTLLDDRTLRELARLYNENFILTEEERKNL